MTGRDIVVIGASAGGLGPLKEILSRLPSDFPGAVLVVMHLNPSVPSRLAEILARVSALPVAAATDGMPVAFGGIGVAPEDHHVLVDDGVLRVVRGPRENRHRPAVDPLFRSAAWAHGPRVVGIVMSGVLDDGTAGLWAIKECGGFAIVQDPSEAEYPGMPESAIQHVPVDEVLRVADIAPRLIELSRQPITEAPPPPRPASIKTEVEFARMNRDLSDMSSLGELSPFTCPSCRGSLWELRNGDLVRYRCHTGHAFSRETLLADQSVAVEEALYVALRAVEEKATALRRLGQRQAGTSPMIGTTFIDRATALEKTADVLRNLVEAAEV